MKIFNFNLVKKFLYFVIEMVKKLLYFRIEVAYFFVDISFLSVSGCYLSSSSFRMAFTWSCFVGLAWRTKGSAVAKVSCFSRDCDASYGHLSLDRRH
jgi:hypothetical protein